MDNITAVINRKVFGTSSRTPASRLAPSTESTRRKSGQTTSASDTFRNLPTTSSRTAGVEGAGLDASVKAPGDLTT